MTVQPSDIKWKLGERARQEVAELRETLGETAYGKEVEGLRKTLCAYFSASDCRNDGLGISRVGAGPNGSKLLKVRWHGLGHGKRGGLRLTVTAHCALRVVVINGFFERRENATDADYQATFERN